jgi:L-lactate permease
VAAIAAQVLVEWVLQRAFDLAGVAAGLAVTTALVLVVLLLALNALGRVVRGLLVAAVVCGGVAAIAFAVPRLVLGDIAAAAVGLVLYAAALAVWRPTGLRQAWAYVRTLQ